MQSMRTTLSIDDDILAAARELATHQRRTVGEVMSDLARQALRPTGPVLTTRNGIPLLPRKPDARPVTLALVNSLRDDYP